jgi:hypothetical protein
VSRGTYINLDWFFDPLVDAHLMGPVWGEASPRGWPFTGKFFFGGEFHLFGLSHMESVDGQIQEGGCSCTLS